MADDNSSVLRLCGTCFSHWSSSTACNAILTFLLSHNFWSCPCNLWCITDQRHVQLTSQQEHISTIPVIWKELLCWLLYIHCQFVMWCHASMILPLPKMYYTRRLCPLYKTNYHHRDSSTHVHLVRQSIVVLSLEHHYLTTVVPWVNSVLVCEATLES